MPKNTLIFCNYQSTLWLMEIGDPQAIRALSHPLRLDLLELLGAISPATAATCGRILGVPQANCSFHLRQLAKYGYVEDAGPGRDRRERQWRVPEPRPVLRIAGSDPLVGQELLRIVVEREAKAILSNRERRDSDPTWSDASTVFAAVAILTAEEATDLKAKWKALIEPYVGRDRQADLTPDRRYVRYFMAATPMPVLDLGETDDDRES